MFGLTVDNILYMITIFITVVGGGFALWQWRKSSNIRRAEFVSSLNEKYRFSDEISKSHPSLADMPYMVRNFMELSASTHF